MKKRNYKKTLVKFLEKELILVLAIVVMLGILIGYSLAAALRTTPEPIYGPESSSAILRADHQIEGETN